MESLVAVAPHCKFRGFDGRRKNVAEVYEILELHEALERSYNTDAHLVAYVVSGTASGTDYQPRINKPGLPYFGRPVEVGVFFCDIDNEGHADWTDDMVEVAMEQYDTLEVLQTAGIYHTAHGARIVQPITEAIPVEDVEPHIRQWLLELEDDGLAVDWACADWTRHFRLPNVRRNGELYRSPYINLTRMRQIDAQAPILNLWDAEIQSTAKASKVRGGRPPPQRINWNANIPSAWHEHIEGIAKAVSRIQTEWHTLFMALAGALLTRKVPHEYVPALCQAISVATGKDTKTADRETSAKTTVDRYLSGDPFTGYQKLMLSWPDVAMAIDRAIDQGDVASPPVEVEEGQVSQLGGSIEEITATLDKNITAAPPGVMLISAECGLGKTEATIREARERKMTKPKNDGNRAPLNSKTAFSVCTNALAEQLRTRFNEMGVSAKRIFGPLSMFKDDGVTPECRHHKNAIFLVAGGQSITREFCEGRGRRQCEFYSDCKARLGYVGPHDDQITIGPHALISTLDGATGTTGLLVIDEPPPLLESNIVTLDNLVKTEDTLGAFDRSYAEALKPVLAAVQHWIMGESTSPKALTTILDIVKDYDATIIENIKELNFPDPRNTAPPLRQIEITLARNSIVKAQTLGRASRILNIMYRALTGLHVSANTIIKDKALVYTHINQDLINALKREGSTIVMDANISTCAKDYEKILGYSPPLRKFHAPDGAPIKRVHLYCSEAARKYWIPYGKVIVKPSLVNAVQEVFKWAKADLVVTKLGLITLKPIRLALDCILRPTDQVAMDAWEKAGQLSGTLEQLQQILGPVISGWNGEIILGHYGAMRGLNTMADVDCLITLGDPWTNIGQVARDMDYLGMPESTEERIVALCRDELEQAHGRLRTIHRTRPGRAMHIGRVLPGGSGWNNGEVEIRKLQKSSGDMSIEELEVIIAKIGSVVAAAKVVGCSRDYLYQCKSGRCPVSKKIGNRLRRFIDNTGSI